MLDMFVHLSFLQGDPDEDECREAASCGLGRPKETGATRGDTMFECLASHGYLTLFRRGGSHVISLDWSKLV